uniref:Uncharacterized protein n=1 Tax=Hemiselmis andersenii TaxID=464988 RepID=A0A7S1HDT8_HEMAN|mmetsp:Transcript_55303/g.133925  ORF Transcript_55303/g.133925 Transcript_55303/m.133925 type:complete len:329 (+) Transcript_55303:182-1168(+)
MAEECKLVVELREMGVGLELDDATLMTILRSNGNDMDQTIDAIFALSLQEEAPAHAAPPQYQQYQQPPASHHAPQAQAQAQAQEAEEEEEIDEMTAILLGLPWPPPDKPKKPQPAAAAPPAHQALPPQAAAFSPSHQQNASNGFGNSRGDGFQTVSRPQPPRGGGEGMMPQLRLVVLVGPPGCGKSTAAEMFGSAGWFVVSQDALGSRQECEHACWAALEEQQRVVVDRTNIDEVQRSHWVGIARKTRVPQNGIVCLSFNVHPDVCKQRVMSRKGHRTLPATEASMQVVDRFVSSFVPPRESEGFCKVVNVSEYHDPRVFSLIEGRVP